MSLAEVKKYGTVTCCSEAVSHPGLELPENEHCHNRTVLRGELVCLPTDPFDRIYYLRKGSVKAVRYSRSGKEVIIDQYKPGSLFGQLCFCEWAVCDEAYRHEVTIALEHSEVVVTNFAVLKNYIGSHPDALLSLLEDYCRRLAIARMRIESLVLHEARECLARILFVMAAGQHGKTDPVLLDAGATHEELARLIGVSRPFLTNVIRELRKQGLIETKARGRLLVYCRKIARTYFSESESELMPAYCAA